MTVYPYKELEKEISRKEGIEEGEDGIRLEFDKEGQVIGIEISEITKRLAKPLAKRLAVSVK